MESAFASPHAWSKDVVGIGALNTDFIAGATALGRLDRDFIPEFAGRFEHGTEAAVDDEEIAEAIEEIGFASLRPSLGGSAYLALHALARMDLGLRLGYVGVLGASPIPAMSARRSMTRLQIDASLVKSCVDQPTGQCLSYLREGERTLLTSSGANGRLPEYIRENFDALVDYLCGSRLVHVTSFLDDRSPAALLELLSAVKGQVPEVRVSFDPGHVWASMGSGDIRGILELTDYLLLNHREFVALSGARVRLDDATLALRIFERYASTLAVGTGAGTGDRLGHAV